MGMDLGLVAQLREHRNDVIAGPGVRLAIQEAVGFVGQGLNMAHGTLGGELPRVGITRHRPGHGHDAGGNQDRQHNTYQRKQRGKSSENQHGRSLGVESVPILLDIV